MNSEFWRYIFDAIEEPVFLHDTQFRVLLANQAYCREAGMTEAEVLGKPYWEVFPPGTGPLPGCKDAVDRKDHEGSQEVVGVGAKLYLSKSYTVRDDQGKLLHALHMMRDITAQRQAEAALSESEECFRCVIDTVRDAIITLDGESGAITAWNPAAEAMFGYSREETIGRVMHEIITPLRFREAAMKGMAHFVTTGEGAAIGKTLELVALHKNGTEFPIELSLSAMQIHGKWHATGIVRDISERKHHEDKLRTSEQSYRTLAENLPGIVYRVYVRERNRMEFFNRMAQTVTGYSAENLAAGEICSIEPLILREDRASVAGEVKRAVLEKRPFTVEYRLKHKSGDIRHLLEQGTPIYAPDGGPLYIDGVIFDITERKRAEEALRENQAQLDLALRSASMGVWHADIIENRQYFDDQVCRLLGIDPTTFTGAAEEFLAAVHPDDRETVKAALARTIEQDIPYEPDYRAVWPDGSVHYITARGSMVRDDKGQPVRINGIIWDVTVRKQSELALARANRALRTVSACDEALVRAGNESELLNSLCRLIVETGGYRMAWVGFPEQDPVKTVRPIAQYGHDEGYLEAAKISWADSERGRGPTGMAIRTGIVQINQNFLTNPALTPWREAAQPRGYRANVALPLKSSTGTLGVLTIYASESDAFNEAEVALLQELAVDLAFGIETLRTRAERDRITYEHVHHAEILQKSLKQSIQAIADTVEARDPYTAGHQRRVSELAVAIARELGLPEEKIYGIHLAAIIHDLGKVHIPAEILTKPGKLTDIEFMLMKTHPQAGYDILKDVDFPWPIADIVRQHHELLDGSGYPQGLKDGQILLESRIMTVADVVEAMASHRPYRPALGIEAALKEIERGRDSAYDSAVADACLKLFHEGRFAFQR